MPSEIAIVGIATELPSGPNLEQNLDHKSFFQFLLDGGEAYEDIPSDRFNIQRWKGNGAGQISVDKGAFLKGIDMFDNLEFGISSKDARTMAPSTRKLLESSFLALLDSGIDYRAKNIGCYTSGIVWDLTSVSEPDEFDARGSFAGYPSMIANRVSYHLDLLGPSVPTDTACSSSMTAMHLAVQAVLHGECEAAVVAGCQLNHRFIDWVQYSQASLLAPDGKCKPFDSKADGFSRGEGVVAVVIKPLAQAVAERDHIYATILGTAINSAGSAAPPGAPVAAAQCEAMTAAFIQAGRSPREVDYVECHATGTAKGDPTEANWVGEHFSRHDELLLGSVKGNIGHLEITAFLASLSKVCSIFEHGLIPPNVNLYNRNPAIKWTEYRMHVPTETMALPRRSSSNKALISMASSGIGGANGHIVLESPPHNPTPARLERVSATGPVLLMAAGLSPRSSSTVAELIASLEYIADPYKLPVLSTILGRRSKQMTWRSYAVLESPKTPHLQFSQPSISPRNKSPIAFVFCGQGPQYGDMGRGLYARFSVFRQSVSEMDVVFKQVTGKSIIDDHGLFGTDNMQPPADQWSASLVFPSMTIYQIALFDLLSSLGVKPDFLVGHSAGETTVLYASGAGSKAMAVELSIARGQAYAELEEDDGTMAAISCSPYELAQMLQDVLCPYDPEDIVELACYNSPSAVAISGKNKSIDKVLDLAQRKGLFNRKIPTRVPNHSSMMEGCRRTYCTLLDEIFKKYPGPHVPTIPVYSTLTGRLFYDSYDADYFWSNARNQVYFTQAIQGLVEYSPSLTFVEVSPHPVLSSYLSSMCTDTSAVLNLARRMKGGQSSSEQSHLLRFLGELTVLGHNCVDFSALNGCACYDAAITLPPYPFMLKKFPLYPETDGCRKQVEPSNGPLNHGHLKISKETHPSIAEHVIRGESIMPAAGFLEMAIEFGASVLVNVNLRSMLPLPSERPTSLTVELDGSYWSVCSTSSQPNQKSAALQSKRLHADGYLSLDTAVHESPRLCLADIRSRCPSRATSGFYSSLAYFSAYGSLFQRVEEVWYGTDEALASIKGMDEALRNDADYYLHPAILDACFHLTAFRPLSGNYDLNAYYLPARLGNLTLHRPLKKSYFPSRVFAYYTVRSWEPENMQYDIAITDDKGDCLCTISAFEVAKHLIRPYPDICRRFDVVLQPACHKARTPTPATQKDNSKWRPMTDLFTALDKEASQMLSDSADDRQSTSKSQEDVEGRSGCGLVTPVKKLGFDCEDNIRSKSSSANVIQHNGAEITDANGHDGIFKNGCAEKSESSNGQYLHQQDGLINFQETWPIYFELIKERQQQSGAPANHDIVFDSKFCLPSLNVFDDVMRRTLSAFVFESTRRVVRLLLICDNILFRSRFSSICSEFPALFYDIHFSSPWEDWGLDSQLAVGRFIDLDFTNSLSEQHINAHSFDVVIDFCALPANLDITTLTEFLESLLIPGGALILMEKNRDAWEHKKPGVKWHNLVFGKESEMRAFSLTAVTETLSQTGFRFLTLVSDVDPFHFIIECQTPTAASAHGDVLYNDLESFTFEYHRGQEDDLQWSFSGLDPMQELDIWVIATAGEDGDAALGLLRGIRREMLKWTIRLVIFPSSITDDARVRILQSLPNHIAMEPEIIVEANGDLMIPRMIPISAPDDSDCTGSLPSSVDVPEDHAAVQVLGSYSTEVFAVIFGRVLTSRSDIPVGSLVTGISHTLGEYLIADAAGLCLVPPQLVENFQSILCQLAGFVIAVLALSLSVVRRPGRLSTKRILLTHCDSLTGLAIRRFFDDQNVPIKEIPEHAGFLHILQEGLGTIDLVISGYVEQDRVQALKKLLRRGRVFSWKDKEDGVLGILQTNPCVVGDSISECLKLIQEQMHDLPLVAMQPASPVQALPIMKLTQRLFDSSKTYLLLGGIGSLGAHIALWMYENGARSLVLTSRSGKRSLEKPSNLLPGRIFKHLQSRGDLHLKFEAADASSIEDMTSLLNPLKATLAGCMILTAVTADRLFMHLSDQDFSNVFAAKADVFLVLSRTIDIRALDFLVAFSSVSGTFGVGGQSNYDAANTLLEGLIAPYSNAISFVAPGITDSGLMLASGVDAQSPLLSHFIEWSMSAEEMTYWLADAIRKLLQGHIFASYIPDLDWEALNRTLGMTCMGSHFVPSTSTIISTEDDGVDKMAELVIKILNIPRDEFSNEVPLTTYGLDSLSASRLAFSLHGFVEVTQIQLLADMTFTDLLKKLATERSSSSTEQQDLDLHDSKAQVMNTMLASYTADFPRRPLDLVESPMSPGEVVLVTGTTGALGANILIQLVDSIEVKRVYAFNRPSTDGTSLRVRQQRRLRMEGLPDSYVDNKKVVLVEGDISLRNLGVGAELHNELSSSVTHILHNAWRVDMMSPLAVFEDLIKGTRQLVDFALQSRLPSPPCLSFISTIGVYRYPKHPIIAPEEPIDDPYVSIESGYIESKWVAEQIIQKAGFMTPIRTSVIRVGQLAGGINGGWNVSEWVPSMVKSGLVLKCLPSSEDTISWMPAHLAARVIVEMRHCPSGTLHIVHPRPVTWNSVAQRLAHYIDVPLVPYNEWVAKLQGSLTTGADSAQSSLNPALKMMDFFRLGLEVPEMLRPTKECMGLLPKVALDKSSAASKTLSSGIIPQLNDLDVERWVRHWRDIGFLPRTAKIHDC